MNLRNILWKLLIHICAFGLLYAPKIQGQIQQTPFSVASKTKLVRYYEYAGNNWITFFKFNPSGDNLGDVGLHRIHNWVNIGGVNADLYSDGIYRSKYTFGMMNSIPEDATINSIQFVLSSTTNTSLSVTIGKLADENITEDEYGWGKFTASGNTNYLSLPYSSGLVTLTAQSPIWNDIVTAVRQRTSFTMFIRSNYEGAEGSYSFINAGIYVNWTPKIDVTVQSSPSNAGNIIIDGISGRSIPYTPNPKWDKGSTHTLQAGDGGDNNTFYPFVNWTNVTAGNTVIPGNPITVSPTSNTVYQANYGPGQPKVTITNSLGVGQVVVDGEPHSVPYIRYMAPGTSHVVSASDQDLFISGMNRTCLFRNWVGYQDGQSYLQFTVSSTPLIFNATYGIPYFYQFTNGIAEAPSTSQFNINGTVQNASCINTTVYSDRTLTVSPVDQSINNVNFAFDHWSDGYGSASRTITNPSADGSYALIYKGTPSRVANLTETSVAGDQVAFNWNIHQSPNVTYQVWRSVKQWSTGFQLLTTLNHGVTSWSDNEFTRTDYYQYLVSYDIRAYYVPDQMGADPYSYTVYADLYKSGKMTEASSTRALPTEYKVGNFPNPFNPSTTISYQIVDDADVCIDIIDVTGRSIANLVNELKTAGYYSVKWAGGTNSGQSAASGVYFYTFRAKPNNGKSLIVKSGKLLLAK